MVVWGGWLFNRAPEQLFFKVSYYEDRQRRKVNIHSLVLILGERIFNILGELA